MKRCPQCQFIYEDDQSLCDMDGVLLVLDSRTLPNIHALTTVPVKTQQRRNRAVPAFATLILMVVLGMVYYVSTRRHTVPTVEAPASAVSIPIPAPVVNPTPSAKPSAESNAAPPPVEMKPAAPAKKPVAKTVAVSVPQPKPMPAPAPKKEQSKVGSILKKTGRILTKPFKF